jgi:dienelactone hydrolase
MRRAEIRWLSGGPVAQRATCALLATLAATAILAVPGPAAAASPAPLGLGDCGPAEGVYQCSGLVDTWDGVPLDTTVTLPDRHSRDLPLIVEIHGFGNSKYEYLDPESTAYTDNAYSWARDGYAVLTYTARGLWGSCGTPDARLASPAACAGGYIHLADVRYEGRDTLELAGRLADSRFVDHRRIGVTGDSYGGGQSLMLAALRNRVMLPDGSYEPWRSPEGRRLRIRAAAPVIPWTDLVYAAAPNGRVPINAVSNRRVSTRPVGVQKATVVNAIFAAAQFATGPGQPLGEPFVPGRPMGFLAPPGTDAGADVAGWVARTSAGEPYDDARAKSIVRELTRFHSPLYVSPRTRPAPLFLASGFTDDLFPTDEVIRYANRTRRLHPEVPLSLMLGDFGHQRASNEPLERERLLEEIHAFMDLHLRGAGVGPRRGVAAYVQRCPKSRDAGRAYRAAEFRDLTRGKLRTHARGPLEISSTGVGDPAVGRAIDPVAGGGDSCVVTERSSSPGTARVPLFEPTRPGGVTMIGAPRLRARLDVSGADPVDSQIATRLWDVAPGGNQRLVARGLYRPRQGANTWQLHPGAWRFAAGHTAELELLGADPPYGRPSNFPFSIEIRNLRVLTPVR